MSCPLLGRIVTLHKLWWLYWLYSFSDLNLCNYRKLKSSFNILRGWILTLSLALYFNNYFLLTYSNGVALRSWSVFILIFQFHSPNVNFSRLLSIVIDHHQPPFWTLLVTIPTPISYYFDHCGTPTLWPIIGCCVRLFVDHHSNAVTCSSPVTLTIVDRHSNFGLPSPPITTLSTTQLSWNTTLTIFDHHETTL